MRKLCLVISDLGALDKVRPLIYALRSSGVFEVSLDFEGEAAEVGILQLEETLAKHHMTANLHLQNESGAPADLTLEVKG